MNQWIKAEYERLRRNGWRACDAIRAARVKDAWDDAENAGLVKVDAEPDCLSVEDTEPDWDAICINHHVAALERKEYRDRCNRDGLWIYAAYYRTSVDDEWILADSIGGFVGSDWKDSGYDTDMRETALEALEAILDAARTVEASMLATRATYAGVTP
jgi:hypothetical protein